MNIFQTSAIGRNQLTAKTILTDPILFLAFGFGSGLARKAPGTAGTLAAIPLYYLLMQFDSLLLYSIFTVLTLLAGIWICDLAAQRLGEHDYGGIVWDEIVGYLITLWLVPFSWTNVLLGFVLFRLFDIAKPWPIKWADRQVSGGLGIMLDDVLAGIFAGLILLAMQTNNA